MKTINLGNLMIGMGIGLTPMIFVYNIMMGIPAIILFVLGVVISAVDED